MNLSNEPRKKSLTEKKLDRVNQIFEKIKEDYNDKLNNASNEAKVFFTLSNLNSDINQKVSSEDVLMHALERYDEYHKDTIKKYEPKYKYSVNLNNIKTLISEISTNESTLLPIYEDAIIQYEKKYGKFIIEENMSLDQYLIELFENYQFKSEGYLSGSISDQNYIERFIDSTVDYKESGHDITIKNYIEEITVTATTSFSVIAKFNLLIEPYILLQLMQIYHNNMEKVEVALQKFRSNCENSSFNMKVLLDLINRTVMYMLAFNHEGLNIKMLQDNDYNQGMDKDKSAKQKYLHRSRKNQEALENTYNLLKHEAKFPLFTHLNGSTLSSSSQEINDKCNKHIVMTESYIAVYKKLTDGIFTDEVSYRAMKKNKHEFSFLMRDYYSSINSLSFDLAEIDPYEVYSDEIDIYNNVIFLGYHRALSLGLKFQFIMENITEEGRNRFEKKLKQMKKIQKLDPEKEHIPANIKLFEALLKIQRWSYLYPLAILINDNLLRSDKAQDKKLAKSIGINLAHLLKDREDDYMSHEFENKLKTICKCLKNLDFDKFTLDCRNYIF